MLAVAWILAPLLLLALCVGCGLLVAALAGRRLPAALLGVCGFALIAVAGQLTTLTDATAELTTPLSSRWRSPASPPRPANHLKGSGTLRIASGAWWGIGAGAAVFAVYAAPIVLSGEPTIAGFIKLDDTATWLALTDRIADHGRDLGGLRAVELRGDARVQPRRRLPDRRLRPARRRRRAHRLRPRLADRAVHGGARRPARRRAVGDRRARSSARTRRAPRASSSPPSRRCSTATTSGAG